MNSLNQIRPHMRYQQGTHNALFRLRALAAGLVSVILAVLILLTSCSIPWATDGTGSQTNTSLITTDGATLDRQNLARSLVTCVTDTSRIKSIYDSIPSAQLESMSLASFDGYIRALARMISSSDPVTSFRFVTETERQTIIDAISVNASDYFSLLQVTTPIELLTGDGVAADQPIYIFIQTDDNGTPYLSAAWVNECMKIYDAASLYINALEAQDQEAVGSLISDSELPEEGVFSSQVIDYKARELIQYYHIKVKSEYTDYQILSFDISKLTFLQPEVLNDNSLDYQSRTVSFVRNTLNHVYIQDSVNVPLDSKNFYLYYKNEKTIRIGDRGDSNQFRAIFGDPLLVTLGVRSAADGNTADNNQVIVLTYSSASVTILGNLYDDGSWDGQIQRIRLRSANQDFTLGTSIYTGMTRDELMMMYPFADQTGYVLKTTVDDQAYEMTFTFTADADRKISAVKLEMVD